MGYFSSILNKFNPSQLTVITFLLASFLGGLGLFITESNTVFVVDKPSLVDVNMSSVEVKSGYGDKVERHVLIEKVEVRGLSFIDALFTSVSALCVTGLTTIDFSSYTLMGQILVLFLIQLGGLGIIVFTSIFAFAIFRGLSERLSFKELLSSILDTNINVVYDMLKEVAIYTVVFQSVATLILSTYLYLNTSININGINPIWWSLFHSISAFNNAGFSLMQNNLANFPKDIVINVVIGTLIILGGIGYPVLISIYRFFISRRENKSKLAKNIDIDLASTASLAQIKVSIVGTLVLIVFGMLVVFFLEFNNPIFSGFNGFDKALASFFQSVSTRTAGFNTVDIGSLHTTTIMVFLFLMFVGANPAGTAGGVKITTIAVLYGYIRDWFRAPGRAVTLFKHNISRFAVSHAIRLLFFSTIYIGLAITLVTLFEDTYISTPDSIFNLQKIIFEVVSAFGTVGLSMGYSGGVTSFSSILGESSKIIIILTMFIGRVGPLTLLQAQPWKHPDAHKQISPDYENSDRMQIG